MEYILYNTYPICPWIRIANGPVQSARSRHRRYSQKFMEYILYNTYPICPWIRIANVILLSSALQINQKFRRKKICSCKQGACTYLTVQYVGLGRLKCRLKTFFRFSVVWPGKRPLRMPTNWRLMASLFPGYIDMVEKKISEALSKLEADDLTVSGLY
jgi:hypothetical protein